MTYQVSRDGEVLGHYDQEQIFAGLEQGEFLPTDYYWGEGMAEWQLITCLQVATASPQKSKKNPAPVKPRSDWRTDAATEKQITYLQSFGISPKTGLSKGEASDLIDKCQNDPAIQARQHALREQAMEQERKARGAFPSFSIRQDVEQRLGEIEKLKVKSKSDKASDAANKKKLAALHRLLETTQDSDKRTDIEDQICDLEEAAAEIDVESIAGDIADYREELKWHQSLRAKFWKATFDDDWIEEDDDMELTDFGSAINDYYVRWGQYMKKPSIKEINAVLSELDAQSSDWDKTKPEAFYAVLNRHKPESMRSAKTVLATQRRAGIASAQPQESKRKGCMGMVLVILLAGIALMTFGF